MQEKNSVVDVKQIKPFIVVLQRYIVDNIILLAVWHP